MVNFPINLRCYVLLGCRVINVILAINIGDSAFFDIAALVRQFGGLRHHQQTESIHWPPPQTKILATPLVGPAAYTPLLSLWLIESDPTRGDPTRGYSLLRRRPIEDARIVIHHEM